MNTPLIQSESSNPAQLPEQQAMPQATDTFLNTICLKREHVRQLPPLLTEETLKRWQKHEYPGQKEYQPILESVRLILMP